MKPEKQKLNETQRIIAGSDETPGVQQLRVTAKSKDNQLSANSSGESCRLDLPAPFLGFPVAILLGICAWTSGGMLGTLGGVPQYLAGLIIPAYWIMCLRKLSTAVAIKYDVPSPIKAHEYLYLFLCASAIRPAELLAKHFYGFYGGYSPFLAVEWVALLAWLLGQSVWIYKLNSCISKARTGSPSVMKSLAFAILPNIYLLLAGWMASWWWFVSQGIVIFIFSNMLATGVSKTKITKPKADSDIVIEYHPFAALTRWRKQQEQSIGKMKILIMTSCLGILFLTFACLTPDEITATKALLGQHLTPTTRQIVTRTKIFPLLKAVFFLNGRSGELEEPQESTSDPSTSSGTTGNGSAGGGKGKPLPVYEDESQSNLNFLSILWNALWISGVGLGLFVLSKPTYIGLGRTGWRFIWFRPNLGEICGPYQRWNQIKNVSMHYPEGKTGITNASLCFTEESGWEKRINLGSIDSVEDRETILKAIQKWAPDVEREAEVIAALEPPPDHSYTELWMQALSAPPKRERLKPLVNGISLKNQRFKVVRQIGTGGQGQAYIANDTNSSGTVVLKEFILPVFVDVNVRKNALEQFENEAKILRQLDHHQIVKLVDFFVEDHRAYLVLEHISGASLRELVNNGRKFSEEKVVALANQMCDILKYLHGLNPPVVHRDFTPDNLILNDKGLLKLIDFNVAKQVVESTTSGTVVGKHAYLPPEQFRGMPECASDIYAMGGTLHFLLTGKDPEPLSVSRTKNVMPELSDKLARVIEICTALDSTKRYKNPADLKAEINKLDSDSNE